MAPTSPGPHSFRPSPLFLAPAQRSCLFLFHRLELLLEKTIGRSIEVATPDNSRLFLRCSYEVEGKNLSLTRTVCEESGRSTECRAFSLPFLGFSFPLRPPPKPLFPLVLLWSWLMFDVGMLRLSSLSTAYGNIMLIFLAASDDCVLAVKIPFFDVGSRCSLRFRRFCSYAGEITVVSHESNVPVLFL
ncbi:hypothetical protein V6N12_075040 [Hibiscus sabdariffa]|uniref:Uncharacterized protein n=1 Tax=Hibiscus sabdariffa TaxID=183260 RepID=A0ABR2BZB3_9ROSI